MDPDWQRLQAIAQDGQTQLVSSSACQHLSFLPFGFYPAGASLHGLPAEALADAAEQRTALPC
jgi:hypothetical protein